jgi:DNA polymerase III epsilon subunit-like protein
MRHDASTPDSWVAIDFETASLRGTPCSVGLIEVDRGRFLDQHTWLIRPPVFEFWGFNVALHGITPEMCVDAMGWQDSLAQILEIVRDRPLVAHNASFDMGVIRDACDLVGITWPRLRYACTLVIGRHVWPGLSTYSLPFLAAHLSLIAGAHHDAAEDAVTAARIAHAALDATRASTLEELVEHAHVTMGVVGPDRWFGCRSPAAIPTEPTPGAIISPEHPLFEKTVAFTGALVIPRRDAQQAVVDRGAIAGTGVTRRTDYLVTGYQDLTKLARGSDKSHKLQKAETLRAEGLPIEIITESDFVQLLGAFDPDPAGGFRRSIASGGSTDTGGPAPAAPH